VERCSERHGKSFLRGDKLSILLKTTTDFKHGISAYSNRGCRCDVCVSAKSEATRERRARLRGKEPPEHGTSSSYSIYGCRCEICIEARKKSRGEYKKRLYGKEPSKHGLTGYSIYGCRCDVCVSARKESDRRRLEDPKNYELEKERCWRKYGIVGFSYSDYRYLYDKQDGKCAICSTHMEMSTTRDSKVKVTKVANVDHNHETGKVRALLCNGCNKMLGCGGNSETLKKGAAYLDYYEMEV